MVEVQRHAKHSTRSTVTKLTPCEKMHLQFIAEGLTAPEVAKRLWVVESTVHFHRMNAYKKLGVHNGAHAVATAIRQDLI